VVQFEAVLKGHGFTACGKTRVVTGLCPVRDHHRTGIEQKRAGMAFSRAVSAAFSLRLLSLRDESFPTAPLPGFSCIALAQPYCATI
jgi:hypothetical protein